MRSSNQHLEHAFVEDHRQMTRALLKLMQALQAGDDRAALALADELDRVSGPHIEFEESVLYPAVAERTGHRFEERLLREHAEVLAAIRKLRSQNVERPLSGEERSAVLQQLQTGLRHVETCGRLLSHLSAMSGKQREEALARLLEARQHGLRWTEWSDARASPTESQRPGVSQGVGE